MSAAAKPFQAATVRAAVAALRPGHLRPGHGRRRFLIADEVGLGKTLVARDVIATLSSEARRPFTVFYVTSGSKVGDQNKRDLLAFLPEEEKIGALSLADRLGLVPFAPRLKGKIRLYAFSPETSFPASSRTGSPGKAVERAFVSFLLDKCYPGLVDDLPRQFFQHRAIKSWPWARREAEGAVQDVGERFVREYRRALRAEFAADRTRDAIVAAATRQRALLARLRRALADASLAANPPDLVILDEFQCYRDLLRPGSEDRLAARLLEGAGDGSDRPGVLLLSATPYRSYAERWEVSATSQPYREFFEVVKFLAGEDVSRAATSEFARFGDLLHALGRLPEGADGAELMRAARHARDGLEALLRPYISRTERIIRDGGMNLGRTGAVKLLGTDLDVYRHFLDKTRDRLKSSAMAYWLSVPLPAQALGARYQISRGISYGAPRNVPQVSTNRLYVAARDGWGSAKLRRLHEVAPPERLALPWVSPSVPWWPLGGGWSGAAASTKMLIFSRFRATPQSIASLTSLEVERRLIGRTAASYRKAWTKRRLQPKRSQGSTLALFHPSPFLIENANPLAAAGRGTVGQVRAGVRRQLVRALSRIGVEVARANARECRRHRPGWEVLASVERTAGHAALTQHAWQPLRVGDAALDTLLREHAKVRSLNWISPRELEDLVSMALAGPAVALGRALRRHYSDALGSGLPALVHLCWTALRPYLDNPVFWSRLGRGTPTEVLQRAVLEGGFEAVMDEHFWMRRGKVDPAELARDLQEALGTQVGWFTFRSLHNCGDGIRVRCHAAVSFGGSESEKADGKEADRPPRTEEIRAAFNTPFWPHVLATTSVGQEGLDFHTWCDRIGHWDLCSSPVDLEQREGRIQRFGGLMVRRRLGEALQAEVLRAATAGTSPWQEIASRADARFGDDSGLSPWWTLAGAHIERHLFALPQSRDVHRFDRLCRKRSLYRLALGQPRQEELIELLGARDPKIVEDLATLTLDLSAYGAEQDLALAAE